MKITKLEKKKRLYLLELDESDQLYITEDTIVRFMLSKDKQITPEELKEIRHFAQFSYGKNLALYHLSFKQRSKKEVSDYLQSHDIQTTIIPQILNELEHENWINDEQYAQNLIEQNRLSGDKGPHSLQQKLQQKGIEKEVFQRLVSEEDFEDIAKRTVLKLLKTNQHKLPLKALKDKLTRNLINKGFSYQQAKQAISGLELETDHEQEEELIHKELDKLYRNYSKKYDGYDLKQRLTQALARKGYDYQQIQSALREYL